MIETTTPPARAAIHVMLKPRGPVCNLDCAYCYYLPKAGLYPGSNFRMTEATLERFTRQYLAAQPGPEATFAWQGGEPTLMGLDFFRRAVQLQQKYRPAGVSVLNSLQTNATTLNAEWCRFFRDNGFLIGVSLDGPAALHDVYRLDKGGAPSFDKVMAGLALLSQHGVPFNVLATVHAANERHPVEVYRFLRDSAGAQYIQFIPIVQREEGPPSLAGNTIHPRSVGSRGYGEFLITVFDEWVRRDVGRVFVQMFDVALAGWLGEPAGLCVFEEVCGASLAMEHNGDVYSCDHFVEPHHRLGNLESMTLAQMAGSTQQQQFGLSKRDALPGQCRSCEFRFVCNGGCPKDRVRSTPDGQPGLNYLCEGYKAFFRHIDGPMRFMAGELHAERPAANIMARLTGRTNSPAARTGPGRNDPCPCGSGLKFKKCHGRVT
jgi:uncharacterized protein